MLNFSETLHLSGTLSALFSRRQGTNRSSSSSHQISSNISCIFNLLIHRVECFGHVDTHCVVRPFFITTTAIKILWAHAIAAHRNEIHFGSGPVHCCAQFCLVFCEGQLSTELVWCCKSIQLRVLFHIGSGDFPVHGFFCSWKNELIINHCNWFGYDAVLIFKQFIVDAVWTCGSSIVEKVWFLFISKLILEPWLIEQFLIFEGLYFETIHLCREQCYTWSLILLFLTLLRCWTLNKLQMIYQIVSLLKQSQYVFIAYKAITANLQLSMFLLNGEIRVCI